jgi:hypothetical protein
MKNQALPIEEIRRIGDNVLNAVRLSDEEIDKIVSAPQLFDEIRSAIEPSARASMRSPARAKGWPLFDALRQPGRLTAVASILVFAIAIGVINRAGSAFFATLGQTEDFGAQIEPLEIPSIIAQGTKTVPAGTRVAAPPREQPFLRTVRTRSPRKTVRPAKEIEMGEFQALTYTGEGDEMGEGGQIVRVELSRAALFAMGVDVPVENETGTVKTDLLIGFDGVMRGVRVEKRN